MARRSSRSGRPARWLLVALLIALAFYGAYRMKSPGESASSVTPQVQNRNPTTSTHLVGRDALPPQPSLKEDDPTGCSTYLGGEWTDRIEPALLGYLAYPSTETTDAKLAGLQDKLTTDFYQQTADTWHNSSNPRSWVTNVSIDTCQLQEQKNNVQPLLFGAFLTIKDRDGNANKLYFTYDAFIVRDSNKFFVLSVTPSGAVAG